VIIICPSCSTQYVIPDGAITQKGRLVKCTKCAHQWLEKSTSSEEIPHKEDPILNKAADHPVPAIVIAKIPTSFKITAIILSILVISSFLTFNSDIVTKIFPQTKDLYARLGIYNSDGWVFNNFTFQKHQTENGLNLIVKGFIKNESTTPKYIPIISIALRDKNKDKLLSHIVYPAEKTPDQEGSVVPTILNPGESFAVNTKITNLTELAQYLNIDFGNQLELLLINQEKPQ